jgi:hypothetical protein
MDEERGTGRTTRQILKAPQGALYIWVNSNLFYPKMLAHHLGRQDIKFASPRSLRMRELQGRRRSQIIIDHAAVLDREMLDYIEALHD